jgi:hypothetical protein
MELRGSLKVVTCLGGLWVVGYALSYAIVNF